MDWSGFWATYNTLFYGVGVKAMLALSIYLTLACGMLTLANAAFMGIGAYSAALVTLKLGLPFPLALAIGAITPGLVALIIGAPVLRLSGVYVAMATLAFGEVVRVVLLNLEITGGPMGLSGIPLKTDGWWVFGLLALVVYIVYRMRFSKMGRAYAAIAQNDVAAQVMGVNVPAWKLQAFVLGAMIAGLAGGLSAHYTSILSPGEFGFTAAVDILTMAVLGGTVTPLGPMIGSTILTVMPELLRFLQEYRMAVNGLILVLVVLFLPNGVWDPRRWQARWKGVR